MLVAACQATFLLQRRHDDGASTRGSLADILDRAEDAGALEVELHDNVAPDDLRPVALTRNIGDPALQLLLVLITAHVNPRAELVVWACHHARDDGHAATL